MPISPAEIIARTASQLPFAPTAEQQQAIEVLSQFLLSRQERPVMIMRGSAGTGKTTLTGAMVRMLIGTGLKVVLMAPTGRAAKVLALNSGRPATTIHRRIYREQAYQGLDGRFQLGDNTAQHTLFVVDEASMVASGYGEGGANSAFGTGRLLDDLVGYVYAQPTCRLMLIGDAAQLPPVGESEAPALSRVAMEGYGLTVYETDLNQVVRQQQESGILKNATAIRQLITHDMPTSLPRISVARRGDVSVVRGDELIESLASSYASVGIDDTIVITRSNKRAGIYNRGIRAQVLDREEELSPGDIIMVVKNNYHFTMPRPGEPRDPSAPTFLANGDRARVMRVRHVRELYGFRFAEVRLCFPDYDDYELTCTVLLDTLTSDAPALSRDDHERLFQQVMADYADIPAKRERLQRLKQDDFFNALQVKFAYAVTCHKAQGGQWSHVYIDQGYMTDDMLSPDYIHWLYTAFTRATSQLMLVNWPKEQTDGPSTDED